MLNKINGYVNPFSEGYKEQIKGKWDRLDGGHQAAAVILTIAATVFSIIFPIPLLGLGGAIAFRYLVKKWAPDHDATTEKVDGVSKGVLGSGVEWVKGVFKLGVDSQEMLKKQQINEFLKKGVDIRAVENLLSDMRKELDEIESYLKEDKLQAIIYGANRAESTDSDSTIPLDQMWKRLSELNAIYKDHHYQISKSMETARDMIRALGQQTEHKALKKEFENLETEYVNIGTKLQEAFEKDQQQEMIAWMYLKLDQEINDHFSEKSVFEIDSFDQIIDFILNIFKQIKDKTEAHIDAAAVEDKRFEPFLKSIKKEHIKIHELVIDAAEKTQKKFKNGFIEQKASKTSKDLEGVGQKNKSLSKRNEKKGGWRAVFLKWLLPNTKEWERFEFPSYDLGGLPNIGNTCYMNSSLQAIFNTKLSSDIDLEIQEESQENSRESAHLKALQKLKTVYEANDMSNKGTELTKALKHLRDVAFDKKTRLVDFKKSKCAQQDAAEFMSAALGSIGYQFQLRKTITSSDENHKSGKTHPATYLSLPVVSQAGKNPTLQDLIENFQSEEIDDPENAWRVEDDEDNVVASYDQYTNTYKIVDEIPEVLVIQLKRFLYNDCGFASKINTPIEINEDGIVDMGALIDRDLLGDDESARYQIKATIHHSGSTEWGHYTADVQNAEGEWEHRSDRRVTLISDKDAHEKQETGYMFVLERVQ